MLIKNKKSGVADVATPEQWEEFKRKDVPGSPGIKFSSLYDIVDENATVKPDARTGANVPDSLKSTSKKADKAAGSTK